jgi:hypothetical protein
VAIVGHTVRALAERMVAAVNAEPLGRGVGLLSSVSPIRGGAVLRVAGGRPEEVARYVRGHVRGVEELLGEDPWARKG